MALPQEFWSRLPLWRDEELFEALANPGDYLPEALAAVKDELANRNLPQETVEQREARSQRIAEEVKANEPLTWRMRVIIFLLLGVGPLAARDGRINGIALVLTGWVLLKRIRGRSIR
jgi:hypothetical protein